MNQTQDKARMKRLRTEQAVQFAAQSRWEDAIAANRAIHNHELTECSL